MKKLLILGAGTAGTMVANRLSRLLDRDAPKGEPVQFGLLPPLFPEVHSAQVGDVGVIAFNFFLIFLFRLLFLLGFLFSRFLVFAFFVIGFSCLGAIRQLGFLTALGMLVTTAQFFTLFPALAFLVTRPGHRAVSRLETRRLARLAEAGLVRVPLHFLHIRFSHASGRAE